MSRLEELIAELCPDGVEVEWKALGDVVKTITAPAKVKKQVYREKGEIPIIDQGIDFIAGYTDEDIKTVKADEYDIFGDHSEHIKYVDFAFIQGADGLKILKSKFDNTKYIYYTFVNFYQKQLTYKRHWSSAKETFIPIPYPEKSEKSLEIQSEIVRILDTFTDLTTKLKKELKKELTARKKQYTYFRDKLLTFEEGEVEWKGLGEVFDIFAGGDVPKDSLSDTETQKFNIPVLSNGIEDKALYGWTDKAKIEKPSLTISARGTIGWISFREKPFFPIVRLLVLTPKININLKYAYYYMKTIESNYNVSKNGIPQLTKPMVKDINFPIPYADDLEKSLAEQNRIASILDKFDALTSSITEGLPREIELRQKQYEYYRNMLLSFPKEED